MAIAPGSIVKDFDVIEDIGPRQIPGFVDAFADAFLFQAAEKGFGDGIVPTISTTAHAWLKVVGLAEAAPVIATVLAAWSECTSTGFLGLRRQTAINKASIASSRDKADFIDHPTTLRAKRSTTTAR
jgi:hypothetical protein